MNKELLPRYAMAAAVLFVGLAFAGVPMSSLLVVPVVLICPLMMFVMMRGMGHGADHHSDGTSEDHARSDEPAGPSARREVRK